MNFAPMTFAWIAAIVVLVLCWPIAQALRHERLKPLAAYLLFTSVFALVGAGVFLVLVLAGSALLPAGVMASRVTTALVLLLALLPAFAAARWIVRRPQSRRMPR